MKNLFDQFSPQERSLMKMDADEFKRLDAENERLRAELAEARADVERAKDAAFAAGAMEKPPCFACGYNGPNYYQPNVHTCAARHQAAIDRARGRSRHERRTASR